MAPVLQGRVDVDKFEDLIYDDYHGSTWSFKLSNNVFFDKIIRVEDPFQNKNALIYARYNSNIFTKFNINASRDDDSDNHVSIATEGDWDVVSTLSQYDEGGLEGLARADADVGAVLPEGIDRTEESYKREILKLRIENERLKKTIWCGRTKMGNRSLFV